MNFFISKTFLISLKEYFIYSELVNKLDKKTICIYEHRLKNVAVS